MFGFLDLCVYIGVDIDSTVASNVGFPCLKKPTLQLGDDSICLMRTLFKSCPLLEHLSLTFELDGLEEDEFLVDISCPHLKYLAMFVPYSRQCEFRVCAPTLQEIRLYWNISFYHFVENIVKLDKAFIEFDEDDNEGQDALLSVVQGISSVTYLHLTHGSELITYLSAMDDQVLPLFPNLSHLQTDLQEFSHWKDLLLSLWCFPNLEVLEVWGRDVFHARQPMDWSALYSLPTPLLSKVKQIEMWFIEGDDNDVKLIKYILSNASALEQLVVKFCLRRCAIADRERQLLKEYEFCRALFKLPRNSLTCEVNISGVYIKNASSREVKQGLMTCQIDHHV